MADETIITNETETDDIQKYIDTINEMKKNSVPRSELDKYKDENKKLLESLVNGTAAIEQERVEAKPTIAELRNKLYGKGCENLTDIEYVSNLVQLREALLEETGTDYAAPTGSHISADYADLQSAEKVHQGLKHCLEVAQGNQEVFFQELTRITANDPAVSRKPNNIRR